MTIDIIIKCVILGILFVFNLVNVIMNKKTNTKINLINGVKKMKYRKPDYREKEEAYAQTFSPLVQTYRKDKSTGELVEADVIDIDKLIQSNLDSALDKMLERFMPVDITDKLDGEVSDTEMDLGALSEAMDSACDWREKLNLDPTASLEEVYNSVTQYRDKLLEQKKAEKEKASLSVEKSESTVLPFGNTNMNELFKQFSDYITSKNINKGGDGNGSAS